MKVMRLTSLDVFRGFAIASMVLLNNPGSWGSVYPGLLHAEWHGCQFADLVFPFFLFIAGTALSFSFSKYTLDHRPTRKVYQRILIRVFWLFALGLLLNGFPSYNWSEIRVMGVLQRISLAYFLASVSILNLSKPKQWALGAIILVGYWAALSWVPVPGYGAGNLTLEGNLVGYLDRMILGSQHLLKGGPFDPEGLLSTLPAVVTVLAGYGTGDWLRQQRVESRTSLELVMGGLSQLILGSLWGLVFPINKQLWTSSYVLFTLGWALLFLAFCYETIEVRGWWRWGWPLKVMGMNAIFVFVGSGFLARVLLNTYVDAGESATKTYAWIYETLFRSWAGPYNGSLAFAITTVGLWWVISYGMYRRGWFLKV